MDFSFLSVNDLGKNPLIFLFHKLNLTKNSSARFCCFTSPTLALKLKKMVPFAEEFTNLPYLEVLRVPMTLDSGMPAAKLLFVGE